ncbi:MAG: UDP-N-acetylglucosamine--N-acetylmuramyl-(pentapeptide) pyrophosphoryl-undecaprenol N-acetylglucosamine transferase [Pirellulales bacterium]
MATNHVLFAGGGAAGHLHAGLAVAAQLRQCSSQVEITFAGSGKPRERHIIRTAGYHYSMVPSQPAPHNPIQALRFVTDNVAGYCAARWMLSEQQISLVVGMGGYTSMSVVRAAVARGLPTLLLEQNAIPSRITRWISRSAAMICSGYEEVRPHLHVQAPLTVTGNPARPVFEHLYHSRQKERGARSEERGTRNKGRLVILGGAAGARSLNESMPAALRQLGERLAGWQIVHQTGEGQLQETEKRYRQNKIDALAVTYIDEIAPVLFASDLVVCRAGGTTLSELALAGIPAVLVPYPHASDDHQMANAKVVAAAQACRLINETSQAGSFDKALAHELAPLIAGESLRLEMGRNMLRLARPEAASEIAAMIVSHLHGSSSDLQAA